jgi:hypothetical protein
MELTLGTTVSILPNTVPTVVKAIFAQDVLDLTALSKLAPEVHLRDKEARRNLNCVAGVYLIPGNTEECWAVYVSVKIMAETSAW